MLGDGCWIALPLCCVSLLTLTSIHISTLFTIPIRNRYTMLQFILKSSLYLTLIWLLVVSISNLFI